MAKLAFKIRGMDCAEEVVALKREVGPLVGGEKHLEFNLLAGKMTVETRAAAVTPDAVVEAVKAAGLEAVEWDAYVARAPGNGPDEAARALRNRMLFATAGFMLVAAGWLTHAWLEGPRQALTGEHGYPPLVAVMYVAAVALGGRYVARKAVTAARRLRPDMNLLMTVAVVGAMALGVWLEAAMVTSLFALALLLESWSVGRARHAIEALMDLSPRMARRLDPGAQTAREQPVEDVPVGATVAVLPGDRIPLDGVVIRGATSVNEAPITGESVPVAKTEGDEVFAGTINNEGAFEFRVTRAARDTTLARIIHLVEQAQTRRAPSERWVETFARYYTPAMMGLAVAVAVVPPLLWGGAWGAWFYQALVVLVIACPCALVISTPVSIVAALASAAHAGVLIKGGLYVEAPGRLRAIAFDKTGTLTYGRPEVQCIVPLSGHTEEELLSIAAAVESLSEHPIAQAVLRKARRAGVPFTRAEALRSVQGKGAEARIGGERYWVGSHRYAHELGVEQDGAHAAAEALEDAGHSVVFIGNDKHICGLISVADEVRRDAPEALRALRRCGIEHLAILTGDHEGTARAVAEAAGLDTCRAELLPEDKVEAVRDLVRAYGRVAMVGDGVNDAPAMAAATVGVAMGAAGSDAAIEIADIALMADDLSKVAWLVRHSRRTVRVIQQNVAVALGLKAVFIALACAGLATLWMAIAADMGASLLVIFNGMRLLDGRALEPDRP